MAILNECCVIWGLGEPVWNGDSEVKVGDDSYKLHTFGGSAVTLHDITWHRSWEYVVACVAHWRASCLLSISRLLCFVFAICSGLLLFEVCEVTFSGLSRASRWPLPCKPGSGEAASCTSHPEGQRAGSWTCWIKASAQPNTWQWTGILVCTYAQMNVASQEQRVGYSRIGKNGLMKKPFKKDQIDWSYYAVKLRSTWFRCDCFNSSQQFVDLAIPSSPRSWLPLRFLHVLLKFLHICGLACVYVHMFKWMLPYNNSVLATQELVKMDWWRSQRANKLLKLCSNS